MFTLFPKKACFLLCGKQNVMRFAFAVATVVLLVGCKGGTHELDQLSEADQALVVLSTFPVQNAVNVNEHAAISVTLSKPLQINSVDASSLVLQSQVDASYVPGSLNFVAGNKVSFTPAAPLDMLSVYTATLKSSVSDSAGRGLLRDYQWSFTSQDGSWAVSKSINNSLQRGHSPQIAADDHGNGVAVWQEFGADGSSVWGAHYLVAEGWGRAQQIESLSGYASWQRIACDDKGNAIVTWLQDNPLVLYASRYEVGRGWASPYLLAEGVGGSTSYIAMNENGDAFVIWEQRESTGTWQVVVSHYLPASGWQVPEVIGRGLRDASSRPVIEINNRGEAIAVWGQHDAAGVLGTYVKRFVQGQGWQTQAELIDSDPRPNWAPIAALDDKGDAIVMWPQINANNDRNVYAAYYQVAVGWQQPVMVQQGLKDSILGDVVMTGDGEASAVWVQQKELGTYNVYANHFVQSEGWGRPLLLQKEARDASGVRIGTDDKGRLIAVWRQLDEDNFDAIYMSRHTLRKGWGEASRIDQGVGLNTVPQVAVSGNGRALAVWQQQAEVATNVFNIFAASFK